MTDHCGYLYNFKKIKEEVIKLNNNINFLVVTKNQPLSKIEELIKLGQLKFAENRVQEAKDKWQNIIANNQKIELHLIGKLQSNKSNDAFNLFSYIHTLDNDKLARIFSKIESHSKKKIKYFIQVNMGNELQKNGVAISELNEFTKYCKNDLKINIIGLMCIPPINDNPSAHFKKLFNLAKENKLTQLSMGMSNDYTSAIENGSTYVRIGSKIFSEN